MAEARWVDLGAPERWPPAPSSWPRCCAPGAHADRVERGGRKACLITAPKAPDEVETAG